MTTFLTFPDHPGERLPVSALEGRLRLGLPWELDLVLPAGSREPLPGEAACLALPWEGEPPSRFRGLVAQVETREGPEPLWNLRLASPLWRLSLGRRSRVFVDRSPRQILEEVLGRWGFSALDRAFPAEDEAWDRPLPLACQVRERDLDFVRRWCARLGATLLSGAGPQGVRILPLRDPGAGEVPAGAVLGFRSREGRFEGEGAGSSLVPGARLHLPDHPLWPGDYRVTGVDLSGSVPACRFHAVPDPIPALPGSAPWPSLRGTLRARVEGPPERGLDGRRRHRVRLPFDDREGGPMPLAPLAAPGSAHDLPLDPGTEVVLAFEGGDPDRPIICGVLPVRPMEPAERARPALQGPGRTRVAFPGPLDDSVSVEGPGGAATLGLGPQGWDLHSQGSSFTAAGFVSDQAGGSRLKTQVGGALVVGGLVETDTAHVTRFDLSVAPSVRFHAADAWQWGRVQLIASRSVEAGLRHEKLLFIARRQLEAHLPPLNGPRSLVLQMVELGLLAGRSPSDREIIAPTFAGSYQIEALGRRALPHAWGNSPLGTSQAILQADGARPGIFLGCAGRPAGNPGVRGPRGDQRLYGTRFHVLPRTLSLEHLETLLFKLDARAAGGGSIAMVAREDPRVPRDRLGPEPSSAGLLMTGRGVRAEALPAMILPQLRLEAREELRDGGHPLPAPPQAPGSPEGMLAIEGAEGTGGAEGAGEVPGPEVLPAPRPRFPRVPRAQRERAAAVDGLVFPRTILGPGEGATIDLWAGEGVHVHLDPEGVEARHMEEGQRAAGLRVGKDLALEVEGYAEGRVNALSMETGRLRMGPRQGEAMASGLTLDAQGLRLHGQGFLQASGVLRVEPRPGMNLILEA